MMTEKQGSILSPKGDRARDPFDVIVGDSLRIAREERRFSLTKMAAAMGESQPDWYR